MNENSNRKKSKNNNSEIYPEKVDPQKISQDKREQDLQQLKKLSSQMQQITKEESNQAANREKGKFNPFRDPEKS